MYGRWPEFKEPAVDHGGSGEFYGWYFWNFGVVVGRKFLCGRERWRKVEGESESQIRVVVCFKYTF